WTERGDYVSAIRSFRNGLTATGGSNVAVNLRSRLANALVQDGQYSAALKEVNDLPEGYENAQQNTWDSWLCTKAYGLAALGRFQECIATLDSISISAEQGVASDTVNIRTVAEAWAAEPNKMNYPFDAIREQNRTKYAGFGLPPYDTLVVMKDAVERGRGLFAKEDISKGDYVLIESAFAFAECTENDLFVTMDMVDSSTEPQITGGPPLWQRIIDKIHREPSFADEFLNLSSGSYSSPAAIPTIVDDMLVIDTFLVRNICKVNSMACGPWGTDDEKDRDRDAGLWTKASYLNHSCEANVGIKIFGDMFFAYAKRDIRAGEETTINYLGQKAALDRRVRRNLLRRNWEFDCKCEKCEVEQESAVI
ncbi:hypothetical protein LTS18_010088, partial [Coniosporium uncinatum]